MPRWYSERVLPHLIDWTCGANDVADQRRTVVPLAHGSVLEIGVGTGLNLPFYDASNVERLWGLEPSESMRNRADRRAREVGLDVEWIGPSGEQIPLDDESVDSVVVTYTLCSIPDWDAALTEIRRVLMPGGIVAFCEHGEAPDPEPQRWQRRLNPVWNLCAGGCHLDRPILAGLERNGLRVDWAEQGYRGFPRFATFTTRGVARA